MSQLSTGSHAQRTPAQEMAWRRLWEWLLAAADDEQPEATAEPDDSDDDWPLDAA